MERTEEDVGVYSQEECSIPAGMGKYIPVQINRGITGYVLIEISNKTVTGLILLETVYNVKKKLGCIFIENHNSKLLELKRGHVQTIGIVWLCPTLDDDLRNCLFFLSISQDDDEDEDMILALRSVRPGLGET